MSLYFSPGWPHHCLACGMFIFPQVSLPSKLEWQLTTKSSSLPPPLTCRAARRDLHFFSHTLKPPEDRERSIPQCPPEAGAIHFKGKRTNAVIYFTTKDLIFITHKLTETQMFQDPHNPLSLSDQQASFSLQPVYFVQ